MSKIAFEIVYLGPEGLFRKQLQCEQGTSLADAMALAQRVCAEFPKEAWQHERVAVYGTLVQDQSRPIAQGERIEILRPLEIDPVESRRQRARNNSDRR